MRIIKKVLSFALITAMAVTMTACGGSSKESKNDNKIVIRYQKSIAYAPVMIMAEKNMISKYYDKDLEVDCQVEKDGNTIKEGVSSGFWLAYRLFLQYKYLHWNIRIATGSCWNFKWQ